MNATKKNRAGLASPPDAKNDEEKPGDGEQDESQASQPDGRNFRLRQTLYNWPAYRLWAKNVKRNLPDKPQQ